MSTMTKEISQQANKISNQINKQLTNKITNKNYILNTEYGRLSIIRPLFIKPFTQSSSIIRDVSYFNDNSSTNFLFSVLKKKKDFLLVKPETHFGNSVGVLKSLRKRVTEDFFGSEKKPDNPFRNCKSPKEIFNLARNIKYQIKMNLSRFGYILLKNGELSVTHREGSILQNNMNIQSIMKDIINHHEASLTNTNLDDNKFTKYDYFISAEMVEGIISANNYIQKGIAISVLGDKKVYTNYGVFNPTRQDYLALFDLYLKENIRDIKQHTKNAADLGCGTGILSLIMSQYNIPRIFAFDNKENAILATKSNSQAFGYFDIIKAIKLDIVNNYYKREKHRSSTNPEKKEFLPETTINNENSPSPNITTISHNEVLLEKGSDTSFDLIICNPPWINASYVFSQTDLENAVFDPNNQFLKACFNFAKIHLNRENKEAKFILIFSDFGSILNLNEPNIIENLALEYKFKIGTIHTKNSDTKTTDKNDALKNFKKESKLFLYELKRI